MARVYLHRTPSLLKKLFPKLIWNKPPNGKSLYLTFDDGPVPGLTENILELLNDFEAKATFFCVGANVKKHPDIFEKIIANGHSIGNHTFNHLNGFQTAVQPYIDNVDQCQKEFSRNGYNRIVNLFRPPYGLMKLSQINQLINHYQIIMWDILSGDFDRGISNEKCLNNVTKFADDGSIVVFHDNYKAETKIKFALPRVLQHFSDKQYNFLAL